MKILILALSGIGDALMFTPALRLLKNNFPDSQIDVLAMFKGVKDIFEHNSNVNNILYKEFIKEGIYNSLRYLFKLRGQYELTINVYPSNRKEYNLFNFLIGAPKRVAISYLRQDVRNLGFLNNIRIKENNGLHNVEENINLVEKITGIKATDKPQLEFPLLIDDLSLAGEFIEQNKIEENEIVIGFHPGCAVLKNHIKRRWEPEKFSLLGKKLIERYNARILIFGGPDESELKNAIAKKIDSEKVIVVETGNLVQSAAIMKRCNLFITNDSSLMHVAAAMQLKVIAIIGPTNTNYIYPWQTEHKIVSLNLECSPCFYYSPKPLTCTRTDLQFKCIKELDVDLVYNNAVEFLQ